MRIFIAGAAAVGDGGHGELRVALAAVPQVRLLAVRVRADGAAGVLAAIIGYARSVAHRAPASVCHRTASGGSSSGQRPLRHCRADRAAAAEAGEGQQQPDAACG